MTPLIQSCSLQNLFPEGNYRGGSIFSRQGGSVYNRQRQIDLTTLENTALQALYAQINTYKDLGLKKHLLAQLKQERPDFKPQIDARQFLQHVAYGQQNEAESLLKKDIELAQGLLTARKIPFTDYSGRTFTCTAYEYAYWAKDTHMSRMLEKYMNNTTKHYLLQRVRRIEKLVGEGLFKAPVGLTFTQNGQELRSAHFDLTPLKQALKTYIDAHNKSPKQTEANWRTLDALWVKVGLPQRDVPAHIAQEYCHPNRSFEAVSKNPSLLDAANPNNLVRQLKFCNWSTFAVDSWFTHDSYSSNSGLGFSFAILRPGGLSLSAAGCAVAPGRLAGLGLYCLLDLVAIEAIDKARTDDFKQSLANLTAPSSLLADTFAH